MFLRSSNKLKQRQALLHQITGAALFRNQGGYSARDRCRKSLKMADSSNLQTGLKSVLPQVCQSAVETLSGLSQGYS